MTGTRAIRDRCCLAILFLGLCLPGGCKSLEHVFDTEQKLEMYGGTRSSWAYISGEESPFLGKFFHFLDLPLTLVMDTALFPIAMPVQLVRGGDE